MTRKDFQIIANAIARARRDADDYPALYGDAQSALNIAAQYMANSFAETNPNFDRIKFQDAAAASSQSE